MMDTKLSLAEDVLLLALNDEKGTVLMTASVALPYALAGAIIVELIEAGSVRIDGKELVAAPRGSARDEILDEILGMIRSSKRTRSLNHWVGKIGRSGGKIKEKLLARLVDKRILGREEHHLLWVFPTKRYPQIDPRPEYGIRERVRSAIRGMTLPDERTAALISLIHASDLIGEIFEKGERRDAKRRAKEIAKSQPVGSAVAHAVEAVKVAVIAAASS
jgi:Golgi phosphoprotein 3